MDWTSVALAAVAGAAAGGIAHVVMRRVGGSRLVQGLVVVVTFTLVTGVAREVALPAIRAANAERNVRSVPVFRAVERVDPAAYRRIVELTRQVARTGDAAGAARAEMRGHISRLALKHAPQAADEAVIDLVKVSMTQMQRLVAADPKLCYQYLFPRPGEWVDFSAHLDKTSVDAELRALEAVLRTAAEQPRPVPGEAEARRALETVIRRVSESQGEAGLRMLANPAGATDYAKLCAVVRALYGEILALPPAEQGLTIRYLLASARP